MRRIARTYEGLLSVMAALAMAILPVTAVAVSYEVVMRYAFNRPTVWAVDLAAFALLWITFLTSPWLVRNNGHITIEFFIALLKPTYRLTLRAITFLLAAGISTLLFWESLNATLQAFQRGVLTVGSWEVPRGFVWMIMPLGSFFLIVEFLRGSLIALAGARKPIAPRAAVEEAAEDLAGSL
jgi:C4-dicarboxylate transporter, DctQ subunit